MARYVKKPIPIEAHQWFKNGDHPEDDCQMVYPLPKAVTQFEPFLSEGKVVRRYNCPGISGDAKCPQCGERMAHHGWIDTLEDGHRVCPGDWIITGVEGEHYPCKDAIFRKTYEPFVEG